MFRKNIKAIGILALIIAIVYFVHKFIFSVFKINQSAFVYSLEQLYFLFGFFSLLMQLLLIRVKQKNIDIVGNVFLLLTLIKMLACYFFGISILKKGAENNSLQKWNFLILFLVFLAIETVTTIRLLNKKGK